MTDLVTFINGRYASDERATLVALPVNTPPSAATAMPGTRDAALPLVHILIPDTWDKVDGGLDGIAIDLPALQESQRMAISSRSTFKSKSVVAVA